MSRQWQIVVKSRSRSSNLRNTKRGYEDGKLGVSLRYPLEIGVFLESQSRELRESSDISAVVVETSSDILSSVSVPLATSPPPTTPVTDSVTPATPEGTMLPTSPSEVSHSGKVSA